MSTTTTTTTREPWGKRLNRWHDEVGPFHALKPDGSPKCGARYRSTTGPYPRQPRRDECCKRCLKIVGQ